VLLYLRFPSCPNLDTTRVSSPLILYALCSFIFETELKNDIENACADVEVAEVADHELELFLTADLEPVLCYG